MYIYMFVYVYMHMCMYMYMYMYMYMHVYMYMYMFLILASYLSPSRHGERVKEGFGHEACDHVQGEGFGLHPAFRLYLNIFSGIVTVCY